MHKEINTVLDLQSKAINSNLDCISVYKSFDNWSKTIIETELQSLIKDSIKKCRDEIDGNQLQDLAEKITTQIIELPFHKKSVAIFCTLDLNNPNEISIKLNGNLLVVFSDIQVEEKSCCEKIFDLVSLCKMTAKHFETLCIYVSKKHTKFFIQNGGFRLIDEIENVILERFEDRFTSASPANGYLNSGSSADEKEMKFAKKILNDMVSKLKEIASTVNKYKFLIIYYTDDFGVYADFIENELKNFSETKPLLEKKIIGDLNYGTEFEDSLKKYYEQTVNDELTSFKNDGVKREYKTDLNEIVEAVREARIQKLYVKEDAKIEGFILTKDFPYLEKVDGSVSTDRLVDWIVKKVIETQGEVIVLDSDSKKIEEPITAKFRY